MNTTGTVKILTDRGWEEVPQYHRWEMKVGPEKTPLLFALHACPKDGKTLKVCEITTGCDTQAQVIHPHNGRIIELGQLRKGRRGYLPGAEVRKLARNAIYRLIKRVGELQFIHSIAIQSLQQHKPKLAEEA